MDTKQSLPASRHVQLHGIRLHYSDWENPEAPTLILLHGGRDNGRSWDIVAEQFRDRFHVVAPDLRGHGDSDWSPDADYSFLAYISDLCGLVDHLGTEPVTIVAHSLGASLALRFAALYPESVAALVAIEGLWPEQNENLATRMRTWLDERRARSGRTPRRFASFEEAVARMAANNRRLTAVQARELTGHAVARSDDGGFSWKFDPMAWPPNPVDLSSAELRALWSRILCPTLLICGGESFAPNPADDGRVSLFQNVRFTFFATAGHWVHHDDTEGFVAEVERFLASAANGGPNAVPTNADK